MFDPVSIGVAFSAAQAAIKGVRSCVELYKEAQKVGADASEIVMELTGHIGSFFDHHEKVKQGAEEAKSLPPEKVPKGKSIESLALENVMRARQLAQAEVELREFLIYQTPGLGGVWGDFVKERDRLRKEREERQAEEALEAEAQRIAALRRSALRRRAVDKWIDRSLYFAGFALFTAIMTGIFWNIKQDYLRRKAEDHFSRSYFQRHFVDDPQAIKCWKIVTTTGYLPRSCQKNDRPPSEAEERSP